MKFNIKSLLIILLCMVFTFFFTKWYFSRGDSHKAENEALKKRVDEIQLQRDSLARERVAMEKEYGDLKSKFDKKAGELQEINSRLRRSESELNMTRNRLGSLQKTVEENKLRIKQLTENPIRRKDDALIISLRDKLKN